MAGSTRVPPPRLASRSFFSRHGDHRDLHSFPTRRSSDLQHAPGADASVLAESHAAPQHGVRADRHGLLPHGKNARDRKSTRLNSSHITISYAVFCLKKKKHDAPSRAHDSSSSIDLACTTP